MYGPDTILLASKKPRVIDLINRSRGMTEKEIKSLQEKPDVIRGLLLINQFGDQHAKSTMAEKIATAMQSTHVDQPSSETIPCSIYKAISHGDLWIKTGASMLEVMDGWHWGSLDSGMIAIGGAVVKIDDESLKNLKKTSVYICQGTLTELRELERSRRSTLRA